jgi:hypothetical protein
MKFEEVNQDWEKPTYAELERRIVTRNSIILALGAAVIILGATLLVILSMI